VGYTGILLGPPILGNFAQRCGSLSWSFLLDGLLVASMSGLVPLLPAKYGQLPGISLDEPRAEAEEVRPAV
jgi:hypothetical protein